MATAGDSLWGWENYFEELSRFIGSLGEGRMSFANESYTEYVLERLSTCINTLSRLLEHIQSGVDAVELEQDEAEIVDRYQLQISQLLECVQDISMEWQSHFDQLQTVSLGTRTRSGTSFQLSTSREAGGPGRPKFIITKEQLEYLSSMSFSWSQIAHLLNVSRMTIYRRRVEFGLLVDPTTSISTSDLISKVHTMRSEFPQIGETMVWGQLRSLGIHVTRERVRNALRQTDPLSTTLRWRGNLTRRRPYSVPGPNSLWHIDGHHKLIRWRYVTHCGVDGYTRMVVYLQCSDNNRASTVYNLFLKGAEHYGLPSRVRCDQGGENVLVAQHMIHHRGADRRSVIVGSSVHNQRVERFWRDMHRCVTLLFYRLFYFMENQGILDPVNERDLYALHYTFLPRINRSLSMFQEGWNNHGIRTEHNMTPNQLFTFGSLQLQHTGLVALDFFERVSQEYGIDDADTSEESTDEGVPVPRNSITLEEEQLEYLRSEVNPLEECDDYGITIYLKTVDVLNRFL